MNLYLIRHGKTDSEKFNKRQSPDSPLGKEGKSCVRKLGTKISANQFDLVLTSHWKRALETAIIVSKKLNIPYEIVEGIHEREHPKEVHGAAWESEINQRFLREFDENFYNPDWKFLEKGESIRQAKQRADLFKEKVIKTYPGKNIIVVSHAIFFKCLVTTCLLPQKHEDEVFMKLFHSLSFGNAGITKLEYNAEKDLWKIKYLNYSLENGKFTF